MKKIKLADGRYVIMLLDNGNIEAFSNGVRRKNVSNDGLIISMFNRILDLENENQNLIKRPNYPRKDDPKWNKKSYSKE